MSRYFNYDIGALIIETISLGFAIIAYGGGLVPYDLFNLPAWILGPLGMYSLIYVLTNKKTFYHFAWTMILLTAAVVSALYRLVNVAVVIGIFLVAIGAVAAMVYFRNSKYSK